MRLTPSFGSARIAAQASLDRSEAERRGAQRPADQAETEGKRPSVLAANPSVTSGSARIAAQASLDRFGHDNT